MPSIQMQESDGGVSDDAVHSRLLTQGGLKTTPMKALAVKRFVALGLSDEEAKELLKGQSDVRTSVEE